MIFYESHWTDGLTVTAENEYFRVWEPGFWSMLIGPIIHAIHPLAEGKWKPPVPRFEIKDDTPGLVSKQLDGPAEGAYLRELVNNGENVRIADYIFKEHRKHRKIAKEIMTKRDQDHTVEKSRRDRF